MKYPHIGIDENGVRYPLKKWKISTVQGKDYLLGLCELEDCMIGPTWCRFDEIVNNIETCTLRKGVLS